MPYLLNLIYLLLLVAISPWLVYKALTTGKYRQGILAKFLGLAPVRTSNRPCVWFHAVSVGEVLLLKQVIARFRQRFPNWDCVLSTTTNTGFDVAMKNYPDLRVFYWPLDFTWAVKQALRRVRPALVVLAELELWPNFILAAKRQGVKLAVVNGRMSPRSYRGYSKIRWLMALLLHRIDLFAVQNQDYADRLIDLGAPREHVHVTGSVKYDGVNTNRHNAKTQELARLLGIATNYEPRTTDLVWIVGSTQAPEEQIALDIYRRARERFPNLRLILVPRHKERFDEAADLLARSGLPYIRRSQVSALSPCPLVSSSPCPAIILLDTLGELSAAWGLADVAFVGGSLSQRGGQNMIEPAAYGAAVTFGPHVWNFQETVDRLLEHGAAIQVRDAVELERETRRLLGDAEARRRLGDAAQRFVLSQQGATERTIDLLARLMAQVDRSARAA
jgi:3-deoxy-D-manno-octulosonic-acid transferase